MPYPYFLKCMTLVACIFAILPESQCDERDRTKKAARFVYLADSIVPRHSTAKYTPLSLDRRRYAPPLLRRKFDAPDQHNFLIDKYLRGCDVDRIAFSDFKIAADHNNTALVRHFLAPGASFMLPTDSAQPMHWLVQDLFAIFDNYNASPSDYQFLHLSDETLHYNDPNIINFYMKWKKVYRHNWWNTSEYRDLHTRNRLDWIPLTQLRSLFLSPHQLVPSSRRHYNITFRGNTETNSKRTSHVKELSTALGFEVTGELFKSGDHSRDPTVDKIVARNKAQSQAQAQAQGQGQGQAQVTPFRRPHRGIAGTNKLRDNAVLQLKRPVVVKSGYLHEMADSKFCLQVKGRMPECHRLYEALDCGCIPVFIDRYTTASYARDFEGWKSRLLEVAWHSPDLPFVWADNVSHFKDIFDSYMNSGGEGRERLDRLQRSNMEWWKAAQIHFRNIFESAICNFQK
jgi:hypothetical protein